MSIIFIEMLDFEGSGGSKIVRFGPETAWTGRKVAIEVRTRGGPEGA